MPKDLSDRIGKKYGFFTIQELGPPGPRNQTRWWCICEGPDGKCTNRRLVENHSLVSGNTTSCGCLTSPVKARGLRDDKAGTKVCSSCQHSKKLDRFTPARKRSDGHMPDCKDCRNLARKSYRRANPAHTLVERAKYRAKERGVAFLLKPDDVCIPERCPHCSVQLRLAEGKGPADDSPSLDRIIPELGYVKENVEVTCTACNRVKNDATNQRLLSVALSAFKRATPAEREEFIQRLLEYLVAPAANLQISAIESLEETSAR